MNLLNHAQPNLVINARCQKTMVIIDFPFVFRAKPNAPAEKDSSAEGEDAKQTLKFKEESSNGDKEEEKGSSVKEVKKEDVKTEAKTAEAKTAGRATDAFLPCNHILMLVDTFLV